VTKEKTQMESEVSVSTNVLTIDDCIAYSREIMDAQLSLVMDKQYDFAPEFKEMTVQLYLLGVLWKSIEGLGSNEDAHEQAFLAMQTILVGDGMKLKAAKKRVKFLKEMSTLEDGSYSLAVDIGRQSESDDDSLTEVFDHYIDDDRVSGAFWRLYNRGKKTMLYGGLSAAFIIIWFVTIYMPGNNSIVILAAGVVAAALFIIPVFLIGLLIYWFKIKKTKKSSSS